MTFKKRSEFIYKAKLDCEGFFIRRKNWMTIFNETDTLEIINLVKERLTSKYEEFVQKAIYILKKKDLAEIAR